jgi:hypothetical protein
MNKCLIICMLTWGLTCASIYQCDPGDECIGCSEKCNPYYCITIPPGGHYASWDDEEQEAKVGLTGLMEENSLEYRIVFHNNTLTYPCDTWCSNVNKLFGFSRGFVPVMDRRYVVNVILLSKLQLYVWMEKDHKG